MHDLVVVGAGIHGAGVAQAAAAAGYSVLVLEQTAPGAGTSSRSSKLIHGGLRYLESGQLALVRAALAERERLLALAPGLVERVAVHIPVYAHSRRGPWGIRAGLALYALLGGWRSNRFTAIARRDWQELDGLATAGLRAVFRYTDARTDDLALTRAVWRSAERLGAVLACPARFLGAQRHRSGYEVRYRAAGRETLCHARALVNAAGPWATEVAAAISPCPQPPVELVQGAHVLLEGVLRHGIYYIEAPADRRPVFVMPWRGGILVGTTETPFADVDPARVQPLAEEIEYLSAAFRHYFPGRGVKLLDAYAGLRVLPATSGPFQHRPREAVLAADDRACPRCITIYGGKLTTYRLTAERVLRLLARSLPARARRADTACLPLVDSN